MNGEEKGDSGVETQNSEGNADEEDPLGPNCYYDKSKSFFDNISCDDTRLVHFFCFAELCRKPLPQKPQYHSFFSVKIMSCYKIIRKIQTCEIKEDIF